MISLLLKDFYFIKRQLSMLLLMVIVAIILTITLKDASFALMYMIIMSSNLVLSTISFDEIDNGYPALLSLPVSKNKYVKSKYLGSALIGFLIMLVMGTVNLISSINMDANFQIEVWLLIISVAFAVFFIVTSVSIPVLFKFGVENSRVAIFIVYAGIIALGFGIYKLLESSILIDFKKMLNFINNNLILIALIIFLVGLVIYFVSYLTSLKIFKNKEF